MSLSQTLFVFVFALLYSPHSTHAHITLTNQCWPETNLHSSPLQSHKRSTTEETIEIAHSFATSTPLAPFHLPWPWSYPPLCTPHLASVQSRLCVYTSTKFASGRGISIVTTPDLAAQVAALPVFTDSSLLETTKTNEHSSTWFTSSIPGKGVGTLALHNLTPDTRILRYTPAFVAYLEADLDTLTRESLWSTAITRLPASTRSSFLALTTIYGDPRVRIQDITKANTFQLLLKGVNHLAIYPETSRLNHDCAPNAQYVVDHEMLTHTVSVTREIPEGEEISIAYTSPLEKTAVRQARVAEGFHFECGCKRCVEGARSDQVLEEIETLQTWLNDWGRESRASTELAERLVQLHVQEGLEGFLDVPYGFAALAWNAVGKADEARLWAAKAKSAVLMKDGRGSDALKIWESLLSDAKGHWSYGQRL